MYTKYNVNYDKWLYFSIPAAIINHSIVQAWITRHVVCIHTRHTIHPKYSTYQKKSGAGGPVIDSVGLMFYLIYTIFRILWIEFSVEEFRHAFESSA